MGLIPVSLWGEGLRVNTLVNPVGVKSPERRAHGSLDSLGRWSAPKCSATPPPPSRPDGCLATRMQDQGGSWLPREFVNAGDDTGFSTWDWCFQSLVLTANLWIGGTVSTNWKISVMYQNLKALTYFREIIYQSPAKVSEVWGQAVSNRRKRKSC